MAFLKSDMSQAITKRSSIRTVDLHPACSVIDAVAMAGLWGTALGAGGMG